MTRVDPVETRSTIASARPSRGATSTAPEIGMMSTSMPSLGEEAAGRVRVRGRDAQARKVLDRLVRGVVRDGRREPAAAVAEVADARQLRAGLGEQVDAGHPEVGDPVADELDDVVGPHEQDVEVEVLDARHEAAVVLVEDQPGIVEQPQRRLDQPALVGDGEAEALAHRVAAAGRGAGLERSSLSSIAGSRLRRGCSHDAIRVIVAVLAPSRGRSRRSACPRPAAEPPPSAGPCREAR